MGELKVEIVDMERSLAGQDQSLVEDAATFEAVGGREQDISPGKMLAYLSNFMCNYLLYKHVC